MSAINKNGAETWVGQALPRKEENRLLRGRGKFADDIKLREMLYLKFVRSPYAHAKVVSVDVSSAEALAGVICALTGAEIAAQTQPFIEIGPDPFARIKDYPLAVSKVRYQGEPVVAIVAESPSLADDAAELVQIEYEARDPVVDAEEALTDKSILHGEAGTNRVWNGVFEYGDVDRAFREAAYVVNIDRMHFHRFSSTPLENNVVIAQWNPKDDRIYYECNNSFPVVRHSVSVGAPRRTHRPHPRRDIRYRWQLRHQDYELPADGHVRAGFEESWRDGQSSGSRPAPNTLRRALTATSGPFATRELPSIRTVSSLRSCHGTSTIAGRIHGTSRWAASSGRRCFLEFIASRMHGLTSRKRSPTSVRSAPTADTLACSICGSWSG